MSLGSLTHLAVGGDDLAYQVRMSIQASRQPLEDSSCTAFWRDVSKAKLDVALLPSSDKFKSVFANDPQGLCGLVEVAQRPVACRFGRAACGMEATGSYHEALACTLHDQGLKVSVVNPLRVKRSLKPQGCNKTDATDASAWRGSASRKPLSAGRPLVAVRALQALVLRLDTLQTMYQAERTGWRWRTPRWPRDRRRDR